eukprot:SAG11_NODE_1611_length_4583_cov_3.380687_6_plen_77_part_00
MARSFSTILFRCRCEGRTLQYYMSTPVYFHNHESPNPNLNPDPSRAFGRLVVFSHDFASGAIICFPSKPSQVALVS